MPFGTEAVCYTIDSYLKWVFQVQHVSVDVGLFMFRVKSKSSSLHLIYESLSIPDGVYPIFKRSLRVEKIQTYVFAER